MRQGKFGWFCPTKNEDGSWCKYKGDSNFQGPSGQFTGHRMSPQAPSQPAKENRNWDKEAYEKCASIWAAAVIQGMNGKGEEAVNAVNSGIFWHLFQAVRSDADKRFATGWAKAESTFRTPPAQSPASVVNNAFQAAPADDYEAGNRAAAEVHADMVDGIDF